MTLIITPSPQIVAFAVTNPVTGAPITGGASGMSFTTYVNEVGSTVTPPSIVEVGGGGYKFTPTFTTGHGIFYILNTGVGNSPPFISGYIRPEDFAGDAIPDLHAVAVGKWSMNVSTNVLSLYQEDGTTLLKTFNLTDALGIPSTLSVYTRTPV